MFAKDRIHLQYFLIELNGLDVIFIIVLSPDLCTSQLQIYYLHKPSEGGEEEGEYYCCMNKKVNKNILYEKVILVLEK